VGSWACLLWVCLGNWCCDDREEVEGVDVKELGLKRKEKDSARIYMKIILCLNKVAESPLAG